MILLAGFYLTLLVTVTVEAGSNDRNGRRGIPAVPRTGHTEGGPAAHATTPTTSHQPDTGDLFQLHRLYWEPAIYGPVSSHNVQTAKSEIATDTWGITSGAAASPNMIANTLTYSHPTTHQSIGNTKHNTQHTTFANTQTTTSSGVSERLVEAAIIGSTPKKIIRGNLIAPKAIPKSPPKNPISEHSTRRTKYIYIDSSIRN